MRLLVLLGLLCSANAATTNVGAKVVYMIRHGTSEWNAASLFRQFADYVGSRNADEVRWSHVGGLTDAPLTEKGVADALKLCQALSTANHDAPGLALCTNAAKDVRPADWQPAHDSLATVDEKLGVSYASVIGGLSAKKGKYMTSNLVRAIDTLFFSLLPAFKRADIRNVYATSLAQEVGGGWDGSMFHTRMDCGTKADKHGHEAWDPACVRGRHDNQVAALVSFANMGSKTMAGILDGDDSLHKEFYSILQPVPSTAAEFFQFQYEISGAKRKEAEVQSDMFDALISYMRSEEEAATDYYVIAGHSHYFGHLLQKRGVGKRCVKFGKAMQHNGAVWRAELRTDNKFHKCRIVYGKFKNNGKNVARYYKADILHEAVELDPAEDTGADELHNLEQDIDKIFNDLE